MSRESMKIAKGLKWMPALALASALALTACGSGDSTGSGAPANELSAELASPGVLTIGTSQLMGLPWSSKNASTGDAEGVDPELGEEIADKLGLQVKIVNLGWDSLIPSLQAGRIDVIMSGMLDTPARQQAVDFVDYAKAGSVMLMPAESNAQISTLVDVCGLSAGAMKGSAEQASAKAQSDECASSGTAPIDLQLFPDVSSIVAALDSKRIEIAIIDSGVWGSMARANPDKYKMAGEIFNGGVVGIAVMKGSPLTSAVQEELETLMQNGTYSQLLAEFGFDDATTLKSATINGGE